MHIHLYIKTAKIGSLVSNDPLALFRLFILETISTNTNTYAEQNADLTPAIRRWRPTTPTEMWAYIGTSIYMGLYPMHDVASY